MPAITNVPAKFKSIKCGSDDRDDVNFKTLPAFTFKGGSSHIQGVQRIYNSDWYVFSASGREDGTIAIAYRKAKGSAVKDVFRFLDFDHPGGIDTYETLLVVPCYNHDDAGGGSEIRIYDMAKLSDTTEKNYKPTGLLADISDHYPPIKVTYEAHSAGITRLTDGQYIIAVQAHNEDCKLYFYFSRTDNPADGFDPKPSVIKNLEGDAHHRYENINLLTQLSLDAGLTSDVVHNPGDVLTLPEYGPSYEERLYLVGTYSEGGIWFGETHGHDHAKLLVIPDVPTINTVLSDQHFYCDGDSTFEGGAGIYVNPNGELNMFAVERFTSSGKNPSVQMKCFETCPAAPRLWPVSDSEGEAK